MPWMEGTKVEVNRQNEEWAWYGATIMKSSTSDTPLVQYQTLKSNSGGGRKKPLTELIPESSIRPIPPSSSSSSSKKEETFVVNDVVDVFYKGGWYAGVITQVLPNSSFSVSLHSSPDNNKLQCDSSALRFNVYWVNGNWVRPKKEVITTAEYPEKLGHSSITTNTPLKAILLESSGSSTANDKAEERTPSPTKSGKNPIQQTTPRKEIISCAGISTTKKLKQATPCSDATISRPLKRAKKGDATKYNGGEKIETKPQEVEDGNHTVGSIKMKGSPPNLHVNSSPTSLGAADAVGKDCTRDEIELPTNSTGFQDASAGNIVGVSETDCRRENAIMAVTEISYDVICDDQPLHMCSGGIELDDSRISSGGTMNQWDEARESQVPQIDCTDNKVLRLNSKLPFVKSSPLWKKIDSMEVFQAMPQTPHFHPLYNFREETREGLAIARMVNFANLVETTRKLQLDDPRSIWVSYLEYFNELETHGFDVQLPRNRLNELLAIKDRQEQNLDTLKKCEGRRLLEKSKNEEEIEEFIKKIRELKEKRASARSIKKIQDAKIATLQLRVDDIREGIRSTQLDFERVTVAPWWRSTNQILNVGLDNELSTSGSLDPSVTSDGSLRMSIDLSQTKISAGNLRKKLLVLDVNGVLAQLVPKNQAHEGTENYTLISGNNKVFVRPFCKEFLSFCLEKFHVGVWSSRMKHNLEPLLNLIKEDLRGSLSFCWDRSSCTKTSLHTLHDKRKPVVLKELNKLWNEDGGLPWKIREFNASNTILLDDSPYKALRNPPNTAIFPFTYQYENKNDNSLGPRGDLRVYLEKLEKAENVQEFIEQNPYGQTPITAKHPDWNHYRKVVEGL